MGKWATYQRRGGGGQQVTPECPEGMLPPDITASDFLPADYGWTLSPVGMAPGAYFVTIQQSADGLTGWVTVGQFLQGDGDQAGTAPAAGGSWFRSITTQNADLTGCASDVFGPIEAS